MTGKIDELSKYSKEDIEKSNLIKNVFNEFRDVEIEEHCLNDLDFSEIYPDIDKAEKRYVLRKPSIEIHSRYCPKCGRMYFEDKHYCTDCLVRLKNMFDETDVSDISSNPQFIFNGKNIYTSFKELLSEDNLVKINKFSFTIGDYSEILHDIKHQAFVNFDKLIRENEIDFDGLDILEKIILFTKSFVKLEYKSSGGQLGYFESDTIFIDDRQTKSLEITTMIHELSHFLIQEILTRILCKLLDASKNSFTQALVVFILSYTPFTQLIDEYSAHNVEGRFTLFGFQDYSSFAQIEQSLNGEMTREEIEITKSIGNTFAISIKDILEALIDKTLRKDIKNQFLKDVLDKPNYKALEMENCQILNDEGFIKSI